MQNHPTMNHNNNTAVDIRKWYDRIYNDSSLDNPVKCITEGRPAFCTYSAGGSLSAATLTIGCIAKRINNSNIKNTNGPILFVVAHMDDADEALDELTAMGITAKRFPALEILPGETGVSPELLGERLATVRYALNYNGRSSHKEPTVIVTPIPALMQAIPAAEKLDDFSLNLSITSTKHNPGSILAWLESSGYIRVESIEIPGEFAVRGGIIDIFPAAGGSVAASQKSNTPAANDELLPVRLDFFDDELESICEVDPDTMASDRRIDQVQIIGADISSLLSDENTTGFWDVLPANTLVILHELMEINEQGRGYYERALSATGIYGTPAVLKALNSAFTLMQLDQHPTGASDPDTTFHLPFQALPAFSDDPKEAIAELIDLAHDGLVMVFCLNEAEKDRFTQLLYENTDTPTNIEPIVSYIHRGFIWNPQVSVTAQPTPDRNKPTSNITTLTVVPYNELLHRFQTRRRHRRLRAGRAMDTFLDLQPGDYVVHRDHGIAKFLEFGIKDIDKSKRLPVSNRKGGKTNKCRKSTKGLQQEYLTLEFAGSSRLHVPATKIDLVQKYVGGFHGRPPLSKLGGKKWSNQKDKVSEAVRDLASELLRLQAAREQIPGIRYPQDTQWQHQFEAEFPYEETEDQLASIAEIKNDMSKDRPMDRLLCGDVGFGKTELAIRAAFKTAEFGKQVAILVPTTVLAEQHARTFKQRFADFPFRVEVMSRFQTDKQCKSVIEALKRGQVDIIIGTHRILSEDIVFADLGLVIIDEEQRFGVEHKKHLLSFRMTADVLTLSATPIPRTLHMSMLGLRDISSLTTAPMDRRAVVTEVIPYNESRIKQAIQRELAREGQIYFVHNRVYNIKSVADNIQKLVPEARILVGHGQMPDRELEKVMIKFIRGQADILVSTTIIESGIDIPNANTMFINDANRFGLADLHQLRGRVGRYKHRAYCYLLLSPDARVTTIATKRLKAIEEYSMLGAGFRIAMRDLEIRGAGNLLGAEQSGHIAAVGYEMYCQLLEQTVKELNNERDVRPIDTEVQIKITGSISKGYIPSDMRRMEAYRRISQARTVPELEKIRHDLTDAYGEPPNTTDTLLQLAEIRVKAAQMDIKSISLHEQDVIFKSTDPALLVAAFETAPGSVRVLEPRFPNNPMEIYFRPPETYLEPVSLLTILRRRLQPVSVLCQN